MLERTIFLIEIIINKLYLLSKGLAFGIVIGENLKANQWVYAIAGGMFLYVSVCNMVGSIENIKICFFLF